MSWSQWYDASWFIERLIRQYAFLPGYDYLWRYRQGDSLLTQRSLQCALQQSATAASGLLRLSEQLGALVTQYEDGTLSRAQFEQQVEVKTKEIRKLSKKIRKDHFLDYLDQRQNDDVSRFQPVDTMPGLRGLTAELALLAQQMHHGISAFYRQDMSRVVGVDHLRQPSFDALSKGIDRLAKTIEKSAERL